MNRYKRHKMKVEKPEASSSLAKEQQDHDLAYYIHDRVELMHQVFSVLKSKELRAMAPDSVSRLSIEDLQELCTEELLGISSKRLCAILDGAEPPSDTESSSKSESSHPLETISLDSISSDEEILSQGSSKKKKHKHKKGSKSKHKKRRSSQAEPRERGATARAGLTVLELLELQARARAIRAQLQQEHANKTTESAVPASENSSSDDEVEIKEEPAEVVEISSDDEKPDLRMLQNASTSNNVNKRSDQDANTDSTKTRKDAKEKRKKDKKDKSKDKDKMVIDTDQTDTVSTEAVNAVVTQVKDNKVTKKVNDLIITVPQQSTRKIKLKRTKAVPAPVNPEVNTQLSKPLTAEVEKDSSKDDAPGKTQTEPLKTNAKDKVKKKQRKKERKKAEKVGSDDDGITLQLSDSEKMDLLEDLDRKHYDVVSSSSSDSEANSDSEDSENDNKSNSNEELPKDNDKSPITEQVDPQLQEATQISNNSGAVDKSAKPIDDIDKESLVKSVDAEQNTVNQRDNDKSTPDKELENKTEEQAYDKENASARDNNASPENRETNKITGYVSEGICSDGVEVNRIDDIPIQDVSEDKEMEEIKNNDTEPNEKAADIETGDKGEKEAAGNLFLVDKVGSEEIEKEREGKQEIELTEQDRNKVSPKEKDLSDGEITEQESSEVEAIDLKPEVVCISDEDEPKSKKKKKKDKKSKKDKKKKKSDFRESADQNFYKDAECRRSETESSIVKDKIDSPLVPDTKIGKLSKDNMEVIILEDDEVFVLSDDSSCYEVEGTVLSKEPTAEEIEALSAKIDEIEREEVVTEEQIREHERQGQTEKVESEQIENVSWRDRYLDSNKVKRVLSTSNILNALRKKNKQLKKKMEESKNREVVEEVQEKEPLNPHSALEEGSIEHYNTLEGSTKYVDPVLDPKEVQKKLEESIEKSIELQVTGEMKKDAKELLRMYKKLLKYNDVTKQSDPNKKKKKKSKKDKNVSVASGGNEEQVVNT